MSPRPKSTREPLADTVYNVLLDQFMDGSRAAGESLNIAELSVQLKVSQTPIREALARLENTGLVDREALRGYRVAPGLSEGEIERLTDARLVIEPVLAALAAAQTTPEFLDDLLDSIAELERSAELADTDPDQFRRYWTSDQSFHRLIAGQSDNRFLEASFLSLVGPTQRFRLFAKRGRTGAAVAAAEHRQIYEALARGDADAAAALMRLHVSGARRRVLDTAGDVVDGDDSMRTG